MKLSIIIPAYNEADTIGIVLSHVAAVLPAVEKEIVIIDDCSTDGTRQWFRHRGSDFLADRAGAPLAYLRGGNSLLRSHLPRR